MHIAEPHDLVGEAYSKLPSYWDDKPKAKGLLLSLLKSFQNPLDLMFEILNGTSLEDAIGVQLDLIGRLWNVPRLTRTDEEYREAIFNIIFADNADTTASSIISILKLATGATNVQIFEHYPLNTHVYVNTGLIATLKELGESITAAGASFNPLTLPLEDGKSASPPAFTTYSAINLVNNISGPSGEEAVIQPGSNIGLDGVTTVTYWGDVSNTIMQSIRWNAINLPTITGEEYFVRVVLQKYPSAVNNSRVNVFTETATSSGGGGVTINTATGQYLVDGGVNVIVKEIMDFILLDYRITITAGDPLSKIRAQIFPAYNTGALNSAANNTLTEIVYIMDTYIFKYLPSYYDANTHLLSPIVCSEEVSVTSYIVDNAGNYVIDNSGNRLIATTFEINNDSDIPLGEIDDMIIGHPMCEVMV